MGQPQAMRTRLGDFAADLADLAATPSGAAFFALAAFGIFHHSGYRELAVAAGGAAIAWMTGKAVQRAIKHPEEPKP